MNHHLPVPICAALSVLLISSCGDDPELVAKREKQRTEITRLKGEIAILEEKIKVMPPDVSEELEQAKERAKTQAEEIAKLESEVSALEARKRSLQDEFDKYRAKYPTK